MYAVGQVQVTTPDTGGTSHLATLLLLLVAMGSSEVTDSSEVMGFSSCGPAGYGTNWLAGCPELVPLVRGTASMLPMLVIEVVGFSIDATFR